MEWQKIKGFSDKNGHSEELQNHFNSVKCYQMGHTWATR